MATSDATPGDGATAYSDLLKQPYKFAKGISDRVHDLAMTWGWTHPRERGYIAVHDASVIPRLLEHLDTSLKGFEPPEADSETGKALTEWAANCGLLTGRQNRISALIPAVVSVVHDVLTRHPQCLILREAERLTKCVTSSPLPQRWGDDYSHVRWEARDGTEYRYRLTIKPVDDSGPKPVLVDIVALSYDFADRHLDELVEICKAGKPIRFAQDLPQEATDRLLPVLAYYCYKEGVTWLMLLSQPKTVLLKFTSATRTEDSYLTCSDVLRGENNHLALSILVSLCFAELRKGGLPFLSPELSVGKAPDISMSVPLVKEPPKDNIGQPISLDDLLSRDVILGFAALGEKQVDEQYPLKRQSEPDLDPLVMPLPSCSVEEGFSSAEPEKKNSSALIVATEQIGSGTCGVVYLASYGRHRVAVKVSTAVHCEGDSVRNEYGTYCAIRKCGVEGRVAPRCYGLFLHKDTTMLITAYSGNCLEGSGWGFEGMDAKIRFDIYAVAKELADAGIQQNSFSPRNVVCDDNGMYRVIDFHRGVIDKSKASEFADEYLEELGFEKAHVVPLPASDDKDLAEDYEAGKEADSSV